MAGKLATAILFGLLVSGIAHAQEKKGVTIVPREQVQTERAKRGDAQDAGMRRGVMSSHANKKAEIATVATEIRRGRIWLSRKIGVKPRGWAQLESLSRKDAIVARQAVELAYDRGGIGFPGGQAGARMMLRLLADKIGRNYEAKRALQIRVYCAFPKQVRVKWKDKNGQARHYSHTIQNVKEYASLVAGQLQALSDRLFIISGGKIAIYYKVACTKAPLTSFRVSRGRYWTTPERVGPLLSWRRNDATVVVFFVPWEDPDAPPKYSPCNIVTGDLGRKGTDQCIFVYTDLKRLSQPEGWTGLGGGLPHEFWHLMRRLLQSVRYKPFVPSVYHRTGDWDKLRREIALMGLRIPRYQYHDFYSTIPSWRVLARLRQKWGWKSGWGKGPSAKAKRYREPLWESAVRPGWVTVRIAGRIDGSDRIHISQDAAVWEHLRHQCPGEIIINGVKWNPEKQPRLENKGATTFLHENVDFSTAVLQQVQGRYDFKIVQKCFDNLTLEIWDRRAGAGDYELLVLCKKAAEARDRL